MEAVRSLTATANRRTTFCWTAWTITRFSDNLLGYTPAPDAIEEFNLITSNAPAEFGNLRAAS